MNTMPSVFLGHGSPMLALDKGELTHTHNAIENRTFFCAVILSVHVAKK